MNPENIDGVNYVEMLKNADPANYGASPYNYLLRQRQQAHTDLPMRQMLFAAR